MESRESNGAGEPQLPSRYSPQLLTAGTAFEIRLAKTAMYANGIWCIGKIFGNGKIRRGCNVLQVPFQIIPLEVPKRGSHPLRGGSKL